MNKFRLMDRIDLPLDEMPDRWYNVVPDLPRPPEEYRDPVTKEPVSNDYLEELLPKAIVAQEVSTERWISIPQPVLETYKLWRPTPLFRSHALERYLGTPAKIYFKYEATSPTGSHKLNSALAQCYLAKLSGVKKLITDTGAAQWGSALAMAGQMFGIDVQVHMIRSSYFQKPYRKYLMETYGATVFPSPGPQTVFGRSVLDRDPDCPGSEGIAVSEALEEVRKDPNAKYSMGAFANHNLLHQTVIGLETKKQLQLVGDSPDFLIASVGCGSNMGGFAFPFLPDILDGKEIDIIASEPESCATLTKGAYQDDFADATGKGPVVKTYSLGHDFIPPAIHAGGLRYHGCAPLIGLAKNEGLLRSVCHPQTEVFEAGKLFAKLHGFLPAPEACHPIRTAIATAMKCKEENRAATIVVNYSGHGLLDLSAYDKYNKGELFDHKASERTKDAISALKAELAV